MPPVQVYLHELLIEVPKYDPKSRWAFAGYQIGLYRVHAGGTKGDAVSGVKELRLSFKLHDYTLATATYGDDRKEDFIVVGITPRKDYS